MSRMYATAQKNQSPIVNNSDFWPLPAFLPLGARAFLPSG